MRPVLILLALLAGPVAAHELWIEPLAFQLETTAQIEAHLVNGQLFDGLELPYLPGSIALFQISAGDQTVLVESRLGAKPALSHAALGDGLHVVVYQSTPSTLDYSEFAKFERFVTHKDLGPVLARHKERGLPETDFVEVYTRFSKALIGVGSGAGADRDFGLETELVALANPYTDDLGGVLPVRLTYRGEVRADAQVELFDKAPDGTVTTSLHRTDASGVARLPVVPGHSYQADAVVLREPEGDVPANAVWQSLWANLTFAVPE